MACTTGKRKFPSQLEADIARANIVLAKAVKHRKRGDREIPIRAYRCPFCRGWHNTSEAKRSEERESAN